MIRNRFEHSCGFRHHLAIGKSQHSKSLRRQIGGSLLIAKNVPIEPVLVSIDLDDQLRLQAAEVSDVRSNRHLAAEVRAIGRKPMPQVPPEFSL
jgi:hypothetical protein